MAQADPTAQIDVLAIVRDQHGAQPPEVLSVIRQDVRADYVAAPALLTERGTDVVLIEHEFGIFGGEAGSFLLSLVVELQQPYVITLHTVLSAPSAEQAAVLGELCRRAALVTVFTETARRMVVDAGVAAAHQVRVVPHGAPTALLPGAQVTGGFAVRKMLPHLSGRKVLSTFGLISASKGIETAIGALPAVVERHPDILYLVAGQTHPEVIRSEGEQYRLSLQRLVRDQGLQQHVQFLDRFLSVDELAILLSSTDLYLTPYRSREQIVSGALTFAVMAGCPVVSTGYYYAEDLLGSGGGLVVPFDDPAGFAAGILHFLDDPAALSAAAAETRRLGADLAWPAVGAQIMDVLGQSLQLDRPAVSTVAGLVASSPPVRPDHLLTLVDDVGIVQHADGTLPNRSSGYCVDDVARLVIVAVGLDRERDDGTFGRMVSLGLSFLRYAFVDDRDGMHNFMSYDRRWVDEPYSGDHLGRAVWALGVVVAAHPPRAVVGPSLRLLEQLAPSAARLRQPRAMAFAVIGLTRPHLDALSPTLRIILLDLSDRLLEGYLANAAPGWWWAEDQLTYDNARLPQALIAAGERLSRPEMRVAGLQALDWYLAQCTSGKGHLQLIGNHWRRRGEPVAEAGEEGSEQPLDAAALVECLAEALTGTGQSRYGEQAVRAFEWFLGRNRLGQSLYDFASGGCRDGLETHSVSENEGAESTLAYFQALLALEAAGLQGSLPEP
jgi:glycosyltransferase involved in cell wall biosynthesis